MRKKMFHPSTFARIALSAILFAFIALARDHKDFNGTWTLLPERSEFAGQPPIQSGTVTIKDGEDSVAIERHFTYGDIGETYFYNDSLSSTHGGTVHAAKDAKTKTRWDHETLHITTTQPSGVTEESYSLMPDGRLLVIVEKPGQAPIRLMFAHQ